MKNEEPFNYTKFEKEAIEKLRSGKGLTGEGGALTGLIKRILEAALDEEISEQLPKMKALASTYDRYEIGYFSSNS